MIVFGTLWSAFVVGIAQSDTWGFHLEDIPYQCIFWLFMGWPGQLVVGLFCPGSTKARLKACAVSFGLAFVISFLWLTADEIAFKFSNPPHVHESYDRDRWWPYHMASLTKVWDEDYGANYWAM